jgi:hypothetical protein
MTPTHCKITEDLKPVKVTFASTLRLLKFRRQCLLDFGAAHRLS